MRQYFHFAFRTTIAKAQHEKHWRVKVHCRNFGVHTFHGVLFYSSPSPCFTPYYIRILDISIKPTLNITAPESAKIHSNNPIIAMAGVFRPHASISLYFIAVNTIWTKITSKNTVDKIYHKSPKNKSNIFVLL